MELENEYRKFGSVDAYFDYICDSTGHPHYHEKFDSDTVYCDGNYLHIDIFEVDLHAPTIILIPGTALYSMVYGELMYKIGLEGFNVIGLDPRGHGRSQGERGDYTIAEIMRDVESVITYAIHEFNDNVSVLGSSQGGIVAFYMAAKDPRIKAATCHNFADLTGLETLDLIKFSNLVKMIRPVISGFGTTLPNTQIPINSYLDLDKISLKYFGDAKRFIEMDPLTLKSISLRAIRSLATTKLAKPIEEIDTPVMVFQGDQDTIFPVVYTEQIYDRLTCKKRMKIFPGLNHACVHGDVEIILPALVDWLKEIHLH